MRDEGGREGGREEKGGKEKGREGGMMKQGKRNRRGGEREELQVCMYVHIYECVYMYFLLT